MGYDIHISRASEWQKNAGAEISAAEWQSVVAEDGDLNPDPANGPHAVTWSAHPDDKGSAWLDWYGGNIYSTNPDRHLVAKMLEIAAKLEARVIGDENEPYDGGEG